MALHIEDEYGRRYKKVPADYMIWNNGYFTGEHKTYIPFCKWKRPDDPDNYDIDIFSLLVVGVDWDEEKILKYAGQHRMSNLRDVQKIFRNEEDECYWASTLDDKLRRRMYAKQLASILLKYTEV